MKTCFNTITAGPEALLEDVIAACGRAGFDGVEIDVDQLTSCLQRRSLADVQRHMADAGLAVASLMAFDLDPFGGVAGVDTIRRAAELATELGAPILLTYCAAGVPAGMTKAEALHRAGARAALYADAAAPVAIALEPIGRTELMGGPTDALEVARLSGRSNVGIMMDTFHYYLSRVPAVAIRSIPRDKLLIVHINDAEDRPIPALADLHRLHPGYGILPLQEDVRLWQDIGYDGFVSVEIFRPAYWAQPVEQVVREAKDALDAVLRGSGSALQ